MPLLPTCIVGLILLGQIQTDPLLRPALLYLKPNVAFILKFLKIFFNSFLPFYLNKILRRFDIQFRYL